MATLATGNSRLTEFTEGTVAFWVKSDSDRLSGNPSISTRRTTLHEVWCWYETALDIASLPTTTER